MSQDIHAKLQTSRKELLDIGLRNNLISFKKNAKNLAIVQRLGTEVFEALYVAEKALGFVGVAKSAQGQAADAGDSLEDGQAQDQELLDELSLAEEPPTAPDVAPEGAGSTRRAPAQMLQTALESERLFLQLLKMQAEAKTFVEEQGVNILFLAVGFLHWYESESASEARRAPLVLVPVRLERASAQDRFRAAYTGDDLVFNLSLAAKLRSDFGIQLPEVDPEADMDVAALQRYMADVQIALGPQPRWSVQPDDMVLGFFSFGKFLMFKDLDPQSWPADSAPASHPLIGRLMGQGFGDAQAAFDEDVRIDTVIAPGEVHFVKDADSSQTQAILEVRAGSNLVIQGPPGTGKSQTITNLIAELTSQGKSVLFVSEKMAALEVVKRRLDECHLGDAVLELHSQRATKTSVLAELRRSLEQGKPLNDSGQRDIESLRVVQDQLNRYCDAVSANVGVSGLPFLVVLGHYLRCKREWPMLSPLGFAPMAAWTQDHFHAQREKLQALALQVKAMGRPDGNPFWGSERTYLTPIEENEAAVALAQALSHVQALQAHATALSQRLMLGQPATLQDMAVVCRAARRAQEAPKLTGVHLSTQDWQLRRDALRALLAAGQAMSQLHLAFAPRLIDQAWEKDLLSVRQALLNHGSKWWRFLSSEFRAAKGQLQALAKTELPKAVPEMLAMVDAVLAYQQQQKVFDQHQSLGQALLGAQWQGVQSDWPVLQRITEWVMVLHDDLGRGTLPAGIVDFLAGHADAAGLGAMADEVQAGTAQLQGVLGQVRVTLGLAYEGVAAGVGVDLQTTPLPDLAAQLQKWQASLADLYHVARFNALAGQVREASLGAFADWAVRCEQAEQITALLDLTWYSGLIQGVYASEPLLQRFDRIQHEHQIERFRALDLASMQHAQTQLAAQVWARKPSLGQPGEMAVLRTELNKKRKHLPIRQLMAQAGRAIQQIKPVFMMSPMSIANFLPPGKMSFDVVIFDEASQVKAVDAFGAIMRGKQLVVVGDDRQMPPTDFFGREMDLDDEESSTADIESILSLCKVAGCPERYLRWHYRSRHESLIAVSNAEFYESKLVIFPSAGTNALASGIHLTHLPDTVYDRGRTRTNKEEAKAVAQAVMAHALSQPHMTLGVAAFSVAQRDLISVEVELLRRKTPEAEAFFSRHPNEPFFVKNLENIQGDERDSIFISVGYGRNESGRVAKEFGPLNKDGGHRRLNVLITRAKMVMRVFSNFKAEELELDATAKHGVRALKNFLKFADTRELEVAQETGRGVDSPFEAEVLSALRSLGYNVEPQVGTAGYFIDMAVRHPDLPGRYLLAIECDGAAYHSSRSARDRDRLRQGVLEGLGWTFHRIWSTDWFRNRQQEIERVVAAIEAARLAADQEQPLQISMPAAVPHVIARDNTDEPTVPSFAVPYLKAQLPPVLDVQMHQVGAAALGQMVAKVVSVEGPVHLAEVTRRLMEAFGIVRAGSRITSSVQDAVSEGQRRQWVELRGEFLYVPGKFDFVARDRSAWPSAERKIEWVAPEEVDAALLESLRLGFSLSRQDAAGAAIEILGFGRATQRIAAAVDERLDHLIKTQRAILKAGMVSLT
jgi:very-short-patch-repair endonuclease/DNA polymerase III delta prime subunit